MSGWVSEPKNLRVFAIFLFSPLREWLWEVPADEQCDYGEACFLDGFTPALASVDEGCDACKLVTRGFELLGGFEGRATGGDDVLEEGDSRRPREVGVPLDVAAGAVIFASLRT